jgi:hypothetical protein
VKALMLEAEAHAIVPFDSNGKHKLIIKSISAKQRPRRPGGAVSDSAGGAESKVKKSRE